jgi:hypothetical protein
MVRKKGKTLRITRLRIIIAAVLTAVVAAAIVTIIVVKRQPRIQVPPQVRTEIDHPEMGIRLVSLHFPTTGAGSLGTEIRPLKVTADKMMQLRSVIEELEYVTRDDLIPCLPESTKLRNLLIDSKGLAYVDLSLEFLRNHPGGLSAEQSSINCLVLTLADNFPEIAAVSLLVDGKAIETIAGHIDASQPFIVDEIRRLADVR